MYIHDTPLMENETDILRGSIFFSNLTMFLLLTQTALFYRNDSGISVTIIKSDLAFWQVSNKISDSCIAPGHLSKNIK